MSGAAATIAAKATIAEAEPSGVKEIGAPTAGTATGARVNVGARTPLRASVP
jgi:hypothetical protein